jgi:high-affinity iron transporter
MLASFLLALREGLEGALIVGILLGTLTKLGRTRAKTAIWSGTGFAILLSIIAGYVLNLLGGSFEGRAEEIFEGITMLVAAGILTWVIVWMQNQSREINQKLKDNVKQATDRNDHLALFSLAFISVFREGIELAIFLTAVAMDSAKLDVLFGAGLGLISVVVIAVLLFRSLIQLDLGWFFQVTSIILLLFAAGLVAHGIHEFNEAGLIPPIIEHLWDINHILDENSTLGQLLKALLGYNGNPSLTEVVAYILYFVILSLTGFRFRLERRSKISTKEVSA